MTDIAAILTFKAEDNDRQNAHYAGNKFRARALLQSIERFAPQAFREIIIICPPEDMIVAKHLSNDLRLNIRVVDENVVLPPKDVLANVSSWYRQQICKLSSCNITNCSTLLQLDPDMIIRRTVCSEDFFVEGRLLTQLEDTSHRPERWSVAAKMLNYSKPIPKFGLSVTPALLSTEICRRLNNYMEECYKRPAASAFAMLAPDDWRRTWTEYACYTLFAIETDLWEKHHFIGERVSPDQPAIFSRRNVWNPKDDVALTSADVFDEKDLGIFFIYQSATGVSHERFLQLIDSEIKIGNWGVAG